MQTVPEEDDDEDEDVARPPRGRIPRVLAATFRRDATSQPSLDAQSSSDRDQSGPGSLLPTESPQLIGQDIGRFERAIAGGDVLRVPCEGETERYLRQIGVPQSGQQTVAIRIAANYTLDNLIDDQLKAEKRKKEIESARETHAETFPRHEDQTAGSTLANPRRRRDEPHLLRAGDYIASLESQEPDPGALQGSSGTRRERMAAILRGITKATSDIHTPESDRPIPAEQLVRSRRTETFDLFVLDGMARELRTEAAAEHRNTGPVASQSAYHQNLDLSYGQSGSLPLYYPSDAYPASYESEEIEAILAASKATLAAAKRDLQRQPTGNDHQPALPIPIQPRSHYPLPYRPMPAYLHPRLSPPSMDSSRPPHRLDSGVAGQRSSRPQSPDDVSMTLDGSFDAVPRSCTHNARHQFRTNLPDISMPDLVSSMLSPLDISQPDASARYSQQVVSDRYNRRSAVTSSFSGTYANILTLNGLGQVPSIRPWTGVAERRNAAHSQDRGSMVPQISVDTEVDALLSGEDSARAGMDRGGNGGAEAIGRPL